MSLRSAWEELEGVELLIQASVGAALGRQRKTPPPSRFSHGYKPGRVRRTPQYGRPLPIEVVSLSKSSPMEVTLAISGITAVTVGTITLAMHRIYSLLERHQRYRVTRAAADRSVAVDEAAARAVRSMHFDVTDDEFLRMAQTVAHLDTVQILDGEQSS